VAIYLVILGSAVAMSLLATCLVISVAPRVGAIDQPGLRKVHTTPTPRAGGAAVFLATLGAVLAAAALDGEVRRQVCDNWPQVLALISASAFVFGVGLLDDIRSLGAKRKLIAETVAAAALCAVGIKIASLGVGGLWRVQLGWAAWPVTILWIVGITNSINLIDGLDGLATGISAIACAAVAAFALLTHQAIMAVLMVAMFGALAGFLFFNFNPAKVFLGDCGSLFLGFTLAGASVMGSNKAATTVGLALPLLAMGVPVFDTLFSMVRRALERRPLFAPDGQHIHHRLTRMGLRQRHAVVLLYCATAASAAMGMFMMIAGGLGSIAIFLCVILLLGILLRALGLLKVDGARQSLRRRLAVYRMATAARGVFDAAQLRLREARTTEDRWSVVADAAREMGAVRVEITEEDARGLRRPIVRGRDRLYVSMLDPMHLSTAVAGEARDTRVLIAIDMRVDDCLEVTAHRVALLGRLIGEQCDRAADVHGQSGGQVEAIERQTA
jgi:UDP-GlcNAc:undecaprenyl-phosphate GlcNAc-1-phosphate transferase